MTTILPDADFIEVFGPAIYFCVSLLCGTLAWRHLLELAQKKCDCITFTANARGRSHRVRRIQLVWPSALRYFSIPTQTSGQRFSSVENSPGEGYASFVVAYLRKGKLRAAAQSSAWIDTDHAAPHGVRGGHDTLQASCGPIEGIVQGSGSTFATMSGTRVILYLALLQ